MVIAVTNNQPTVKALFTDQSCIASKLTVVPDVSQLGINFVAQIGGEYSAIDAPETKILYLSFSMFDPDTIFIDAYLSSDSLRNSLISIAEADTWLISEQLKLREFLIAEGRGIMALANGEYQSAIDCFIKCIQHAENQPHLGKVMPAIFCQIAGCYYGCSETKISQSYFELAIANNPDYPFAYWLLGILLYTKERNYEGAITNFRKAIELGIETPTLYFTTAITYRDKAMEMVSLQKFDHDEEDVQVCYDKAFEMISCALSLAPDDIEINSHAGKLSFTNYRFDSALKYYNKVVMLSNNRNDPEGNFKSDALMHLSQFNAMENFLAHGHFTFGKRMLRNDVIGCAIEYFEKAIAEYNYINDELCCKLSWSYFLSSQVEGTSEDGKSNEREISKLLNAKKYIDQAIQVNSFHEDYHYMAGVISFFLAETNSQKDYSNALEHLQSAIVLGNSDAHSFHRFVRGLGNSHTEDDTILT